MPFNGSGSFSPPGADFPAVANTLIESAKFNNIVNDIATGLSTCITKDGQTTATANIPMGGFRFTGLGAGSANGHSVRYEQLFTTGAVALLGSMTWVKGADIASAATVNLTTATGNAVHITGTTTITAVTLGSGMWRIVIFDGALTLTHHTTNNNLPGAANITTAAGDRAIYWSDGTTVYCVSYERASGVTLTSASLLTNSGTVSASSSADIDLNHSIAPWPISKTIIVIRGYEATNDNTAMDMRVSTDGGSTFPSGASDYEWTRISGGGGAVANVSDEDDSEISMIPGIGNASFETVDITIEITRSGSSPDQIQWCAAYRSFTPERIINVGSGMYKLASAITDIRILPTAGTADFVYSVSVERAS